MNISSRWKVNLLARHVTRYGLRRLSPVQQRVLVAVMSFADDRNGHARVAVDEVAAAARLHRATVYRALPLLVAAGVIQYWPGSVRDGKGYPSRFRIEKIVIADMLNNVSRSVAAARQAVRREATTAAAAVLGTVHQPKKRARDLDPQKRMSGLSLSHGATHSPLTGSVTPTTGPKIIVPPARPAIDRAAAIAESKRIAREAIPRPIKR